jgi:hypothetical protein
MRRIISFILAITLLCAGIAGIIDLLVFATRWVGWMFMGSVLLAIAGAIWLYSDFIDATPNEEILKGEVIPPPRDSGLPRQ